MTKAQIIRRLLEWVACIQASEKAISRLDALMPSPESPLLQSIFNLQDLYTKSVAEAVGDKNGWLEWFRSENAMGDNGYEARPAAGYLLREIHDTSDLAQLILESK